MNNQAEAEENKKLSDEDINQEIIDLVVARLRTMPSDASLSIGGGESLALDELIEDVKEQNDVGLAVIKEQLEYLRSLKDLPIDDNT